MYHFIFMLLLCVPNIEGVNVPSTISADTTWSIAGGPYNVVDNSIVTSGTLTIGAGAQIVVSADKSFTVRNTIHLEGTVLSPVIFQGVAGSTDTSTNQLLVMSKTDLSFSKITHAHFKNAGTCLRLNGDTSEHNPGDKNSGTLAVTYSTFENCNIRTNGY